MLLFFTYYAILQLLCSIFCLCERFVLRNTVFCYKLDCFIRVYSLVQKQNNYGDCSIRVYQFLAEHFLLCWHYA